MALAGVFQGLPDEIARRQHQQDRLPGALTPNQLHHAFRQEVNGLRRRPLRENDLPSGERLHAHVLFQGTADRIR